MQSYLEFTPFLFHTNTTTRRPGVLASRVNGATAQANSDYTLFRRPLPWAVAPLCSSLVGLPSNRGIIFGGQLRWGFVYPIRPTRSGRQGRPRFSLNQEATRRPTPPARVLTCFLGTKCAQLLCLRRTNSAKGWQGGRFCLNTWLAHSK